MRSIKIWILKVFPLILASTFWAIPGFSEGHNVPTGAIGSPLYKVAGRDVIVVRGGVDRIAPLSPTGLLDRSVPQDDPSPEKWFHFELKNFVFQIDLVKKETKADISDALWVPSLLAVNPAVGLSMTAAMISTPNRKEIYEKAIESGSLYDRMLLSLNKDRYRTFHRRLEDGLSAVNSDYEYHGISDRKYGYCWGFSTLARRLTMLAFFDPGAKPPVPAYAANGLKKNEAWFRYYEKKLDQILLRGKPEVIPGFRNIRELTVVPEIEFYLKLRAMDLWADVATHFWSVPMFVNGDKMMENYEILLLALDLKKRTNRGELVKILFAAKDSKHLIDWDPGWDWASIHKGATDVHSVLVTSVDLNRDGTGLIHLWDINFYAENHTHEDHAIKILKQNGRLVLDFPAWFERLETPQKTKNSSVLGQVRIAPEYEEETGMMLAKLRSFCKKPENWRYCSGR